MKRQGSIVAFTLALLISMSAAAQTKVKPGFNLF